MQKSRCWRGLELDLLPLGAIGVLAACAGRPAPASAPEAPAPFVSASAALAPGAAPAPGAALARGAAPVPGVAPAPGAAPVPPAAGVAPAPPVAADSETPVSPKTAVSPPPRTEPASLPVLPKGTLVLHIGDSFAGALGVELGKRFNAAGVRNALEFKTASYIPNWSFGGDIPKYISIYHPDMVLITLGANEIEIPKPDQRIGAIKHLVRELGGLPCVWIAPPLWKSDTGLLKVIQANVAPCRYLDSNALVHDLPRGKDKIHPSAEGREIWAGTVFDWLSKERVGSATQPWALRAETGTKDTGIGN